MKTSFKFVSLAALTAATLALPAAAQEMKGAGKCMPKAESAKCGAKCGAKSEMKCGAKCGTKCSMKKHTHGAKCGAKKHSHKGVAMGSHKCGAKCGAKCASKS